MSVDVVTRLREAKHEPTLCDEAAGEIERLRAVVAERDREVLRLQMHLGEIAPHIGALRLSEPVKPSEDDSAEVEYERLYPEEFAK